MFEANLINVSDLCILNHSQNRTANLTAANACMGDLIHEVYYCTIHGRAANTCYGQQIRQNIQQLYSKNFTLWLM